MFKYKYRKNALGERCFLQQVIYNYCWAGDTAQAGLKLSNNIINKKYNYYAE